jgi:hypothetical protein
MNRKRKRVLESFRSAAEAIGPLSPEMSLFAVTRGQWSMIDAILYCLGELGPAEVSVWTWTIADYEIEAMGGLMARSEITAATLVIDQSADRRNAPTIDKWRDRFGAESVRICKNHAKIARVWNRDLRLLLRGSMNLNFNPRFEQFDLTANGEDFELVRRLEQELPVLPRSYSNAEVEAATKVSQAFERQQLEMFRGVKVWGK